MQSFIKAEKISKKSNSNCFVRSPNSFSLIHLETWLKHKDGKFYRAEHWLNDSYRSEILVSENCLMTICTWTVQWPLSEDCLINATQLSDSTTWQKITRRQKTVAHLCLLKVSRSRNMKQKICEMLTSPKNKRRYLEKLYRLGMFMLWQIAVARLLSSVSLTYLVCNSLSG